MPRDHTRPAVEALPVRQRVKLPPRHQADRLHHLIHILGPMHHRPDRGAHHRLMPQQQHNEGFVIGIGVVHTLETPAKAEVWHKLFKIAPLAAEKCVTGFSLPERLHGKPCAAFLPDVWDR